MRFRIVVAMTIAYTLAGVLVVTTPGAATCRSPCALTEWDYYDDASCTNVVGFWTRYCNNSVYSWGETTAYWRYTKECICGCEPDACTEESATTCNAVK